MTKLQITALTITFLAVLSFIAGSPAFGFIPRSPANFAGIALLLLSGLFWAVAGKGKDPA
jgi:hypothetical protein